MTNSRHTPTPWRLNRVNPSCITFEDLGHTIADCNQEHEDMPWSVCLANASFIVKAVNERQELIECLKLADKLLMGLDGYKGNRDHFDRISAALAKVKGEA